MPAFVWHMSQMTANCEVLRVFMQTGCIVRILPGSKISMKNDCSFRFGPKLKAVCNWEQKGFEMLSRKNNEIRNVKKLFQAVWESNWDLTAFDFNRTANQTSLTVIVRSNLDKV